MPVGHVGGERNKCDGLRREARTVIYSYFRMLIMHLRNKMKDDWPGNRDKTSAQQGTGKTCSESSDGPQACGNLAGRPSLASIDSRGVDSRSG